MKDYKFKKLNRPGYFAGALMLSVSGMVSAESPAQENSEDVEEVVVVGIRQSLEAAADVKRNEGRIVDAVVAEDIGKLPDNNIAEALQRITGVSINSDFGVGESVSIRGLSENRVELNGRSTIGDSRGGVSLEDFPAAFLNTVEVVKSPTADMIEGALGGTIRMETVRPLELDERIMAFSYDGEYADKTEHWAPVLNAAYGDKFNLGNNLGSVGAIANISYQDRELRRDEFFNRVRTYEADINNDGDPDVGNTPSGRFALREQNTVEQKVENRERTAINLSLQWAPESEKGSVYLDFNTTERAGSQAANSILDVGGSAAYNPNTIQDSNGQINNFALENAFVIPKTWSQFRETRSFSHALGGEWDFTDKLTVSGEVAFASSNSTEPKSEFNLRPINHTAWTDWVTDWDGSDFSSSDLRHTSDVSFIQNGDQIPSIVYQDSNLLTDPENLAIRAFYHDDVETKNDEIAVRFDLTFAEPIEGVDFITSVDAGVRFTERAYQYTKATYKADNLYRNLTRDGVPYAVWIDEFEAMFPGSITTINHNNSFDQAGLSGQNDLLTYRVYDPNQLANANSAFNKIQQMLAGTNMATTGSLSDNLTLDEGSYRDITEDTGAIYLQANLEYDNVRAIVGGRYVTTAIESSIYNDNSQLESGSHDYADFLPSLNVTYQASEDTYVRFAAAKVMRRADFNQLSPAYSVDNSTVTAERGSIALDPHRATQYDLSLEHYFESGMASVALFYKDVDSFLTDTTICEASPLTSNQNVTEWGNVCQLDVAGESQSNIVESDASDFSGTDAEVEAAGFAYVEGLRAAGRTGIATDQVINGENGKVQGFELGYQHTFDFLPGVWSGLGVSANYTYADSEQPNGNQLLDISKNTFNTQVYWEYKGFQTRIAYNYRDRFLDTEEEKRVERIGGLGLASPSLDQYLDDGNLNPNYDPTAGNNYREARGQVDFSASWDVNENVTVLTNATNLTGKPIVYTPELGSNWKYSEADRRITVGLRAKF